MIGLLMQKLLSLLIQSKTFLPSSSSLLSSSFVCNSNDNCSSQYLSLNQTNDSKCCGSGYGYHNSCGICPYSTCSENGLYNCDDVSSKHCDSFNSRSCIFKLANPNCTLSDPFTTNKDNICWGTVSTSPSSYLYDG